MSAGRSRIRPLLPVALVAVALGVGVLGVGLVHRAFVPPVESTRPDNPADLLGDIIQVEVRNGSGVPGLAAAATVYLRARGFDVVASGNWPRTDEPRTRVLDRVGNREAALRVARALGLDESHVEEALDPRLYVDATVVIGHDHDALPFAAGR